jgi:hypothetical protein
LIKNKVLSFARSHVDATGPTHSTAHDYYRSEGALAGYLSSEFSSAPGLTVAQNTRFASSETDIVVERDTARIIIELNRTSVSSSIKAVAHRAVTQVALYLHEPRVVGAVVPIYSPISREYVVTPAAGALAETVRIVAPQSETGVPT